MPPDAEATEQPEATTTEGRERFEDDPLVNCEALVRALRAQVAVLRAACPKVPGRDGAEIDTCGVCGARILDGEVIVSDVEVGLSHASRYSEEDVLR